MIARVSAFLPILRVSPLAARTAEDPERAFDSLLPAAFTVFFCPGAAVFLAAGFFFAGVFFATVFFGGFLEAGLLVERDIKGQTCVVGTAVVPLSGLKGGLIKNNS